MRKRLVAVHDAGSMSGRVLALLLLAVVPGHRPDLRVGPRIDSLVRDDRVPFPGGLVRAGSHDRYRRVGSASDRRGQISLLRPG